METLSFFAVALSVNAPLKSINVLSNTKHVRLDSLKAGETRIIAQKEEGEKPGTRCKLCQMRMVQIENKRDRKGDFVEKASHKEIDASHAVGERC